MLSGMTVRLMIKSPDCQVERRWTCAGMTAIILKDKVRDGLEQKKVKKRLSCKAAPIPGALQQGPPWSPHIVLDIKRTFIVRWDGFLPI
jgi:hypothetical protein